MSAIAFWQGFLLRLTVPFGWLVAVSFLPAALGWLGWWLIPKWIEIPVGYVELAGTVAIVCTGAMIFGCVVMLLIWLFTRLLWGGGAPYIDENGRPYPDFVIEAIKCAEARGEKVTDRKILEVLHGSQYLQKKGGETEIV
ncbi:MAG TPA: hypothetical protein VI451_05780 [Anaerolineales bacterium]|nr:hypothetical protein [Anaerolineales bacterium]